MPLNLPDDEGCFLDANILYYCYVSTPVQTDRCLDLLQRVQNGDVTAYSSIRAISDCIHKTMLAEISQRFEEPRHRLIGWLKKHPEALDRLPKSAEVCQRLKQLPVLILPIDLSRLPSVIDIAQRHCLLFGDASIVALMQQHNIEHIATNDDDFDNVPGITVWKPRP